MTDVEIANLSQGFKDLPLDTRRHAWALWRDGEVALDKTTRWIVVGRSRSGVERKAKCCPWGAALFATAMERGVQWATEYGFELPGYNTLGHCLGIASGGELYLSDEAFTVVRPFMQLIDGQRLTDDQVHRIMVPEDFAEVDA